MTRRILSAVAALALAGVVSTASAQDSSAVQAGMAKPTYQVFVSAVNATPATITALKARPTISSGDVTLVNLSDFPEAKDDSAVVVLLTPHKAHIEELRSILGAQTEVTTLLSTQTPALSVADVYAVGTQDNGKLVLFYRPKSQ